MAAIWFWPRLSYGLVYELSSLFVSVLELEGAAEAGSLFHAPPALADAAALKPASDLHSQTSLHCQHGRKQALPDFSVARFVAGTLK